MFLGRNFQFLENSKQCQKTKAIALPKSSPFDGNLFNGKKVAYVNEYLYNDCDDICSHLNVFLAEIFPFPKNQKNAKNTKVIALPKSPIFNGKFLNVKKVAYVN